jgi:hypothetical protein
VRTELVSVPTPTLELDVAYHPPDDGPARAVGVMFHSNVGKFCTGPARFLPPALTRRGVACLSLSRRGHDILANPIGRRAAGGVF